MKIPETSANVGAYYGNDENGQWQPNGVVIDNGVGGGVVGSGDAGIHRPVYPVHVPRAHIPPAGYVMAGPYYGPPYAAGGGGAGHAPAPGPPPDDFADYMWMENEEEFDKQVLQQLEEEALMEQCIEAMLEDEQRERRQHSHNYPTTSNGAPVSLEEAVSRSTLNPLAAEFVPTTARAPPPPPPPHPTTTPAPAPAPAPTSSHPQPHPQSAPSVPPPPPSATTTEEQVESPPTVVSEEAPSDTHTDTTHIHDTHTEEPVSPKNPPEVSATGNDVGQKSKKEIPKKIETKKPKAKPVLVKSETKVQAKKKELKAVKSELKMEEKEFPAVDAPKSQTTPTEDIKDLETKDSKESSPPGPKPINYAAAAKSTKTKQKSTTPPLESTKTTNPAALKQDKQKSTEKLEKKPLPKEKVVQRKNSTKRVH